MRQDTRTYQPINTYGVIGNCHSAILVSPDGSIDWGCLPDFDSPALFCRLLDCERGGYFQISPTNPAIPSIQRYIQGSNVLQTRFSSLTGDLLLTDFMPVETLSARAYREMQQRRANSWHGLVRIVECTYGELAVTARLKVTPNYAGAPSKVDLIPGAGAVISGGDQHAGLAILDGGLLSPYTLCVEQEPDEAHASIVIQATLRKGERLLFALGVESTAQAARRLVENELPRRNFAAELEHTLDCWRSWLARCSYDGPYREAVHRSALTLKMMCYIPTGAIVAAPTTSLPEALGEGRNWDYRYTWLRDASFTLSALARLGFTEETEAFIHWLCSCLRNEKGDGLQIMYGIRGELDLPEYELGHLSGYCESYPVRIGNKAAGQKQLDVFGEVLDCIFLSQCIEAPTAKPLSQPVWKTLCRLIELACTHWHEPDSGIWEVRGRPRHFVYSKVMCWVALDRGIRLAEQFELKADIPRWRHIRDQIRLDILTRGFNTRVKAFTQSYESCSLDASCLYLPLVGFIAADDPRMRSTVKRIMEQLTDEHTFVYRYHNDDGLTGVEGTFLMCTFWLVDNLALQGRLTEARALFEHALGYAGKLGLFSEEIDTATNGALGNYPQAFSHLALIHSALNLQRAEQRSSRRESAAPLVAALMLDSSEFPPPRATREPA